MDTYKSNIGDLKLRASYGVLGNQNVDNYSYQTVYQMNNNGYVFNGISVPGTSYTDGNAFLTWEKSANFNIGADATFLNGNLFLSVDYFDKKTSNILLTPEVSSIYGGFCSQGECWRKEKQRLGINDQLQIKFWQISSITSFQYFRLKE